MVVHVIKTFICFSFMVTGSVHSADLSEEEIARLKAEPGHMKPLGSVGPYFDLPVIDGFPTTREFFNKYVIPSTPVVFKGAALKTPAMENWSDEYFLNHPDAEKSIIFAEGRKKEVRTMGGYMINFKKFVKKYNESDIYMVNMVPTFLQKDVIVPKPLLCDPVVEGFSDHVMWFSSGGTKSVLHNDDVDNINCLYRGNKTLIFINPFDNGADWITKVINQPMGSYSSLNVDAVDFTEYPDLAGVRYSKVFMEAGDCLYIPFKWFHQVNSFGNNLAVNLWFNHYPHLYVDLDESKCGDYTNRNTIDKFEFQTTDTSGENGLFEDEKLPDEMTAEELKQSEEQFAQERAEQQKDKTTLSENLFAIIRKRKSPVKPSGIKRYVLKLLPDITQVWDSYCDKLLDGFFSIMDQNKDGLIDTADWELFQKLSPKIQNKYKEASDLFFEETQVAVQVATMRKDRELVKVLLDRGELDKDVIVTVFGEEFYNNWKTEHDKEGDGKTQIKEEL